MVADWHALMSEYAEPQNISDIIIDNVIDWLSCGLDPKVSTIFIQSQVKEHLDLYMILSCLTPLGWLERCPTYKEQLKEIKARDLHNYAFLGYPVLQAADILLYRANCVPVGEDQLPHLELTREIARRVHSLYKCEIFPEPEALLTKVPRLLGTDGRKMSKSYGNIIALADDKETVRKKVSDMFTDPKRIRRQDPGHPYDCNVFSYYVAFRPEMKQEVIDWCVGAKLGCIECKQRLADILLVVLEPIHKKRKNYLSNKAAIRRILQAGSERARSFAAETMVKLKKAMSFSL
jgi:tryptophanyl-tRNA synthetase